MSFLDRLIQDYQTRGQPRLPTLQALALSAEVSGGTMWKALAKAKQQGLLHASAKKGITLASDDAHRLSRVIESAPVVLPAMQWLRSAQLLREDIRTGVYRPGAGLPRIKQLMGRYGVCYRTMRKALNRLLAGNCIRYAHGRYSVPEHGHRIGSRIVLIARKGADASPEFHSTQSAKVFALLETECSRAGISLETILYDPESRRFIDLDGAPATSAARTTDAPTLGHVLLSLGLDTQAITQVFDEFLMGDGRIAIVDQSGECQFPSARHGQEIRAFSIAHGELCGRKVGEHLVSLGHTNIGFFSAVKSMDWSQKRLEGLERACRDAGPQYHVYPFCIDVKEPWIPGPEQNPAMKAFHAIVEEQRRLRRASAQQLYKAFRNLGRKIGEDIGGQIISSALTPLLSRALRNPAITAWVAASDGVAVFCQQFLHSRRERTPNDISLLSFDDSAEASHHGISSYNFNEHAVVHAMLSHILDYRPPRRRRVGDGRPVEIPGFVTVRRSTGVLHPFNHRRISRILPARPGWNLAG
jgi:DNA-binding LacI/PurR family transcriptional regulator/DNA-binding transcriptional regulator YhcF (GntR family)